MRAVGRERGKLPAVKFLAGTAVGAGALATLLFGLPIALDKLIDIVFGHAEPMDEHGRYLG
jgi:hypothetical protein